MINTSFWPAYRPTGDHTMLLTAAQCRYNGLTFYSSAIKSENVSYDCAGAVLQREQLLHPVLRGSGLPRDQVRITSISLGPHKLTPNKVSILMLRPPSVRLPDGNMIVMGKETFTAPEILFQVMQERRERFLPRTVRLGGPHS